MSNSLKKSDNNNLTTLINSTESLNDAKSTTDDSNSACCITEEIQSIKSEVHKLLMEMLQNKIFDDCEFNFKKSTFPFI